MDYYDGAEPLFLFYTDPKDDGNLQYRIRITGRIGTAGGDENPVYKAWSSRFASNGENGIVLVRRVKASDKEALSENLQFCLRLELRPLSSPAFYYKGYYWMQFCYMRHGSLLTLMSNRFPRGFPESLIRFFLVTIIDTVERYHRRGYLHRAISAAHAYVSASGHHSDLHVALGSCCSMYDLDVDSDHYSASISKWGAAPEAYGRLDDEYGPEADVWLIGITALELAYGGLEFKTRDDLLSFVTDIHRRNRLPSRVNGDGRTSWTWGGTLGEKVAMAVDFVSPAKRVSPEEFAYMPEKRVFSKGLKDLVMACLDFNPRNRASARSLLRYKIFDNVKGTKMQRDCSRFLSHGLCDC